MPATIVFAMLPEAGHLNPTFRMARGLSDRGFDVAYFAQPELAELIVRQGFRVLPWFPELFAAGSAARDEALPTFARRRAITRRFAAMAKALERGEGPLKALPAGPVFCLVDVTQPLLAFALRRAGIPFAYVNTSLPQTRDGAVPPLRSDRPFATSVRQELRNQLSWGRFYAQRAVGAAVAAPLGMCPTYALASLYAERFGVAMADLEVSTMYMPQLRNVPELVLCPRSFDYPRPGRAQRTHVESIDAGRREVAFDFGQVPEDKPLVYASLGSQLYGESAGRDFLRRLVSAFAARPDLTLLVSLGRHLRAEDLGRSTGNVISVQSAPQLAVLKRASVMVTHGGLGSIKECVYHGVPMLVLPLDVDQPGNAARVVHHGVGIRADIDDVSAPHLLWTLDCLLVEQQYRVRTRALQADFQALEQETPGTALVAKWARAIEGAPRRAGSAKASG